MAIDWRGEEEYNRGLVQQGVPDPRYGVSGRHCADARRSGGISWDVRREGEAHGDDRYFAAADAPREGAVDGAVGDDPRVIVRAAPGDPFDADHWWRNTQDVLAVVRETMGLLNVWAGLPVRPHLQ